MADTLLFRPLFQSQGVAAGIEGFKLHVLFKSTLVQRLVGGGNTEYTLAITIVQVDGLETACSPLLFRGVQDDCFLSIVAVSLQLVTQDALHRVALKRSRNLLDGICHRHVLGRERGGEREKGKGEKGRGRGRREEMEILV